MRTTKQELWHDFSRTAIATLLGSFVMSLAMQKFFQSPVLGMTLGFGLAMPLGAVIVRVIAPRIRFRSFIVTVAAQSLLISIVFIGAFFAALFVTIASAVTPTHGFGQSLIEFANIMGSSVVLASVLVSVVIAFTFTAVAKVSNKLGQGVLKNWMTGKYHDPKEETRFFMFLDIKDSTTLAEQLGNLKFSAMVRDFFADMSKPCFATKAEVSHYIGDEAVISWLPKNGIRQANCLRFYFLVQDEIAARSEHYLAKYGHVPAFKAGLHLGPVVATEVGESKSEIVFHGDVMNTTARITGLCSVLAHNFLISSEAATALATIDFAFEDFGEQKLKGKEASVQVFGVNRIKTEPAGS
ncbi:MAG: adenylate/guanylate cyclase domain-containing protein [Fimbriimonadaceae bacterium]